MSIRDDRSHSGSKGRRTRISLALARGRGPSHKQPCRGSKLLIDLKAGVTEGVDESGLRTSHRPDRDELWRLSDALKHPVGHLRLRRIRGEAPRDGLFGRCRECGEPEAAPVADPSVRLLLAEGAHSSAIRVLELLPRLLPT